VNSMSKQPNWEPQLNLFTQQNHGRPTRLGVFEPLNYGVNDYWLEDGLPLESVEIEHHTEKPMVRIVVGDFTHTVPNAEKIELRYSADGKDDGFDVVDSDGRTSVLRFEEV